MVEFALSLAVNVEANLIDWLLDGRGDVIAASMTITDDRRARGVAFSRPYLHVAETVVARHDDPIGTVEELSGRTVVVRTKTSYRKSLERLVERGIDITLRPPAEPLGTDEIISRVADGEYDLTVADRHIVYVECAWRSDVRPAFALGEPVALGWAMRQSDVELKRVVDEYFDQEYRGEFFNVLCQRYFAPAERSPRHWEARSADALSPFDDAVRRIATPLDFDWRLIVAQMPQESRFDPQARSPRGAMGLMQLLPRTAAQLGFEHLETPEVAIEAGVLYLAWLRNRFDDDLDEWDRTWFTLASYNAGYGHVRDARKLAGDLQMDPNRWFGHVEQAMLLLSRPEYARQARHGYVRGVEPVTYVMEIRDRFHAYKRVFES